MIDPVKKQRLLEHVKALAEDDTVLAFSGGADSALMLALLSQATRCSGKRLLAVYIRKTLSKTVICNIVILSYERINDYEKHLDALLNLCVHDGLLIWSGAEADHFCRSIEV